MNKTFTILTFCWLMQITAISQHIETGSVTDIEGNVYKTVRFGDTWWMAENMKSKHFNNGDSITAFPELYYSGTTGEVVTGGSKYDYCIHYTYPGNAPANYDTYGLNYTWSAVFDDRGLCPEGWTVPDSSDWYNLAKIISADQGVGNYTSVGWFSEVGKYLKSDSLWAFDSTSLANDNIYGFNALPSGAFTSNGFRFFGEEARFWTIHEVCPGMAGRYYMALMHNTDDLVLACYRNNNTNCLRCIKTDTTTITDTIIDLPTDTIIDPPTDTNDISAYTTTVNGNIYNEIKVLVKPKMNLITLEAAAGSIYQLYNINGVMLSSGKISDTVSCIDIYNYTPGIYVMVVRGNNFIKQVKFIKR